MSFRAEESVHSNSSKNVIPCPKCDKSYLIVQSSEICRVCRERSTRLIFCKNCPFKIRVCSKCDEDIFHELEPRQPSTRRKPNQEDPNSAYGNISLYGFVAILVVLFGYLAVKFVLKSQTSALDEPLNLLEKFKENFPSQKNETWFHILSVMEKEVPTVKSLILLHGEDKKTSKCLTRTLVSVYSNDKVSEKDGIIFGSAIDEGKDYGEVLEHYLPVVRKHRVFITDLNRVPPSTARIFHSLCDEVSSDIKPSLFIFTLQYDKKTEKLKPLERATAVLVEAWKELPHSDIFPLLSRVVKNVVDVVPEKQISC